jgi:hypothetical protein
MDHITFKLQVTDDVNFKHWTDLQEHIKSIITSVGLHPAWFQLVMVDVAGLEHQLFNNVLSATYNLKDKMLFKKCRVADSVTVQNLYNKFLNENTQLILKAKLLGVSFLPLDIETNVVSDEILIKQAIEHVTVSSVPYTFSLLQDLTPLQVISTSFGVVNIKRNYIEAWFDEGHVDYICEFDPHLHKFYYNMYKQDIIDKSIIRFAFFRKYDYNPIQPLHISFAWPTEEQGIMILDKTVNMFTYIDQVSEIISKWSTTTEVFPNDPIRLENRMKDREGYYFILLGSKLNLTLIEFINLQFEYLTQIISYLCLDDTLIYQYAKQQWFRLCTK